MGWTNSPQYLKHLQKIRSMNPEKRAVTQSLIDELAGVYAGADMQKQLQAMRSATVEEQQEQRLGLEGQRLALRKTRHDNRYDLAKSDYRHSKDVNDTAEILEWANLPLTGLVAYGDYRQKKKEAVRTQRLADLVGKLG